MYSKEDKRKYLILQCRYYKGEAKQPNPKNEALKNFHIFWGCERMWVDCSLNNEKEIQSFQKEATELKLKSLSGDQTPLTLKALLCNRYLHWLGGYKKLEEELKDFEIWYAKEYQQWKTNREQRAEKRRPELIVKCRFYHGEESCPFENWTSSFSWNCEKEWVDSLSLSWLARDRYIEAFRNAPSFGAKDVLVLNSWKKRAWDKKVPFTLLCCLASKYAEGWGLKHEIEENFDFYFTEYLKGI